MIKIDNSMLGDMLSCSTRAWVKYVQHKQMRKQEGDKSRERMMVGSLFHGVFERCLQGEDLAVNLLKFQDKYNIVFPEGVTEEKYEILNLITIAEIWLRYNSTYFRDYTPVAIEKYLEMPLGEEVTFFGTIDALVENQRGELWIVESKTTGWLREEMKNYWRRGSQGMGYWELVRHNYGREPKGVIWNVVEIGKIPPYDGKMSKRCYKHSVKYEECQFMHVKYEVVGPVVHQEHQLKSWRIDVVNGAVRLGHLSEVKPEWVEQYDTGVLPQQGRFTYPGCSQCEFTDWCSAGRPIQMMEGMMEEYIWPSVKEEKEKEKE